MAEENMTIPAEADYDNSEATNGQSEADLLDSILRNGAMAEELGLADESIPEEEFDEDDPSEEVPEDPETSEDVIDEDVDDEDDDEDNDEDSTDTQEADVYTLEDLDEDALFAVKVDGEEMNVPLADLVKNYQMDASISNKGRELGEARKELEEERNRVVGELSALGEASTSVLMRNEQQHAAEYHKVKAELDKLSKDDYDYREVKDKVEEAQSAYWSARKEREALQSKLQEQRAHVEQAEWNKKIEAFDAGIKEVLPEFNEEIAGELREFVVEKGLNPDFLNQLTDHTAVKLMYDFYQLDKSVKSGEAKRKAAPAKRAVPVKKAKGKDQKKKDKQNMVKARAYREDASKADVEAAIRQFAENSLSKL